jgi:2-keto-4-pentenoate hydratase/2-oxohepta-3-ene-1,7-dioic acid hydratase in catechol pathway
MKLATFETAAGAQRIAAIDTDGQLALDLAVADTSAAPFLSSMLALIEAGDEGLAHARRLVKSWPSEASLPLASLKLLAPLPRPNSLRDCLVFEKHMLNAQLRLAKLQNREPTPITPHWYERPTYYKGNRMSVIGTGADVIWPRYSEFLDFELELACIVGRKGKDIPRAQGLDHIFGFTVFNDASARDTQAKEKIFGQGPTKGKDFDTGNVLGPWITTTDEIGDPQNLNMEVRINGERWGGGNSSDMVHPFAAIIAFISTEETIYPGDVIGSGTVGTGCGIELDRRIQPGDVIELEIEKIGILRNRVVRLA